MQRDRPPVRDQQRPSEQDLPVLGPLNHHQAKAAEELHFEGYTLAAISRLMGVSKADLFNHFFGVRK